MKQKRFKKVVEHDVDDDFILALILTAITFSLLAIWVPSPILKVIATSMLLLVAMVSIAGFCSTFKVYWVEEK